ncbi:MAG TPA: MFS transporter [Candidatus Elarobacter sp.]|nr:MFS transporter [Candidatus Elarobacter sp.]
MALLATAHVTDDINQSFIPALLPYLILWRGISHTEAGTLVLAQAIASSVLQPVIGYVADRRSMPWLIAFGLMLAGGGVALVGFMPTLPLMWLGALISGIGVASFQPEAARFANYVAGAKKATGMRWFAAGGNVGFAIGPIFATGVVAAWQLPGTLAACVPVTVVGIIVLLELRRLRTFIPAHATSRSGRGTDDWVSFGKLSAFVTVRAMAYFGFVAFVPLYVVEVLHGSPAIGDTLLTGFLLAGVVGTLSGGPIADRFGRRIVLFVSTALAGVMTAVLVWLTHDGNLLLAIPLLLITGFAFVASQSAFVVLGQEYLPNRMGLASGVTLGLAVSLGGTFSPVMGAIADAHGVSATILCAGALSFAGALIAATLPSERRAAAANVPHAAEVPVDVATQSRPG